MEIKPEHYLGELKLFSLRGGRFSLHGRNFAELVEKTRAQGLALQFHFPPKIEGINLNPGIRERHNIMLSLFGAMAEAIEEFELLPNITFHGPTMQWQTEPEILRTPAAINTALENTNKFLLTLARWHQDESWPIVLGVENQSDPTKHTQILGCTRDHLETMLRDTPDWVNITVDLGHEKLSSGLSLESDVVPLALQMKKRIINAHLHENEGKQSDSDHGDYHRIPTPDEVRGRLGFLNRAVRERIPIVFEVNMVPGEFNGEEFALISQEARSLLDRIEKERTGS